MIRIRYSGGASGCVEHLVTLCLLRVALGLGGAMVRAVLASSIEQCQWHRLAG